MDGGGVAMDGGGMAMDGEEMAMDEGGMLAEWGRAGVGGRMACGRSCTETCA